MKVLLKLMQNSVKKNYILINTNMAYVLRFLLVKKNMVILCFALLSLRSFDVFNCVLNILLRKSFALYRVSFSICFNVDYLSKKTHV